MRFVLSPQVLARTRFVVSPIAETIGTLTMGRTRLEQPRSGWTSPEEVRLLPALRRWEGADPLRARLLDLVAHTTWFPDFLGLAPPATGEVHLADELSQIAAWDHAACRATLEDSAREAWTPQDLDWLDTPELPGRIADLLGSAWEDLIAPDWPRRRRILHREIAFRTALIGSVGWAGAVEGIARDVTWEDPDSLVISLRQDSAVPVDSHLSFVPTTQVRGRWSCDGPVGVALVYGARGSRVEVPVAARGALGRLLGTGRASVLLALDLPATPSQLSADLGLALGTIGGHLSVLDGAGLVHRARTGREVYYRRTELGEALVAQGPDGA